MRALVLLASGLGALWTVTWRRWFKGALHPAWTWRFELLAEVARRGHERDLGESVETLRKNELPARIHPRLRRQVRHEPDATLGGRPAEIFTPSAWTPAEPTLLYLHGGAFCFCSPKTHRDLVSRIAVASGARAIAIDYRKAPEHPFPQGLDDCETAYRSLLDAGVPPDRLFVAGDSAGGALAVATLLRARAAGLPMPRAAVLLCPWVDLAGTGATLKANAPYDYLRPEGVEPGARRYLGGADPRDPFASPVYADLTGLPPMLVQTGSAEIFLSENERLVANARAAGVSVTHEIEPGMIHVWHGFASFTPEPLPAIDRIGAFLRAHGQASGAQ